MNFYYLPAELKYALQNININNLREIRLRNGQPVIIMCGSEYKYINKFGATTEIRGAIRCSSADEVLRSAMQKSVYAFSEQLKSGFITVDGGVRMGICGEYVTQGGNTVTVKNVTSLNMRIPHDVAGVADEVFEKVCSDGIKSVLIFSPPGYGKTTMLRDFARKVAAHGGLNVLVFDERNEIAAFDGESFAFDLGINCDVVRGADKLSSFVNAIRAIRPQVIVTDELYGEIDQAAVNYAAECGIKVIASSHSIDKIKLRTLPFDMFIELTGVGERAVVYDKDFNTVCHCGVVGCARNGSFR